MTLSRLLTDSVVILRAPAAADRYGSRSRTGRDWSDPVRTTSRAHVQPGARAESGGDRDTVTTGIRIWLPAGTDVTATDRIEWDGRTWEVDGEPQRWRPPRPGSATAHVQVTAQQIRG